MLCFPYDPTMSAVFYMQHKKQLLNWFIALRGED